jgi:hypothetical protein
LCYTWGLAATGVAHDPVGAVLRIDDPVWSTRIYVRWIAARVWQTALFRSQPDAAASPAS